MDKTTFDRLKNADTERILAVLTDAFRGKQEIRAELLFSAAYVLYKASENPGIGLTDFARFIKTAEIGKEHELFLGEALKNAWSVISGLRFKFDAEALLAFVLFRDFSSFSGSDAQTTDSIIQLAAKLLNIQDGESVANFCTGHGAAVRDFYSAAPGASYYGNDIDSSAAQIASLRAELLDSGIVIKQENIFDVEVNRSSFDKVFSDYPFALRSWDVDFENSRALKQTAQSVPVITKDISSDWLLNAILYRCTKATGKAVGLMLSSSAWNRRDKEIRRYFVENGAIEAVIALPARMYGNTNVLTTMIVFSRDNDSVMLVDAKELYEKGRRLNTFTEKHLEQILECCSAETKHSKRVTAQQLADIDYNLDPEKFLSGTIDVENGVPFADVIKSVRRGAQLSAAQLDEMLASSPTQYQYLTLGNIDDGFIDERLPYLKSIQKRQEKYCVANNSLILSKYGRPFKVAVAQVKEGRKILANGNLYIIELDETKADPYYIKSFLESSKGTALLNSIAVGVAIPNISLAQLTQMHVPVIEVSGQKAFAARYLALAEKVAVLKRKAEKELGSLKNFFDSSGEA